MHRLDFRVGDIYVQDQFVWDISNNNANPEQYATTFCNDLGLSHTIAPMIAWHIRDQVYKYKRAPRGKGM